MKPLDDFLPGIRPYAPGVADPTAYFGIRQAAIEFCEKTRLWRFDDTFTIAADDCEQLLAPSGAVIHEVEALSFNGYPLKPKTPDWLDEHRNGWREGLLSGAPEYFTQTAMNTVTLVPRASGTVSLSLWLKPAQDCDELPDFMVEQFRELIAHGALGRILLIPNQSFSNVEMGAAFGAAFQSKLDSLSTKGFTGQQRAKLRTKASFL